MLNFACSVVFLALSVINLISKVIKIHRVNELNLKGKRLKVSIRKRDGFLFLVVNPSS